MVMPALAVAGVAMQVYGTYKASKDKAAAMREQAAQNRLKAEEILKRNELNKEALFKKAKAFKGTQTTQITAAGGGLGASAMALIAETSTLAAEEAESMSRAAEWESNMVRMGADSTQKAAGQVETAGKISALGQGLSGGASTFKSFSGQEAPSKG